MGMSTVLSTTSSGISLTSATLGDSQASVSIDLDRQLYEPGQVLKGTTTISSEYPIPCNRILVRVLGRFLTRTTHKGVPYTAEKILFEQKTVLYASNCVEDEVKKYPDANVSHVPDYDDWKVPFADARPKSIPTLTRCNSFHGLEKGKHSRNFEFLLPTEGLVTSFTSRYCISSVRYEVAVEILQKDAIIQREKINFPMVVPKAIPRGPNVASQNCSRITVGKNSQIQVVLVLYKTVYLPTEKIEASISISNGWKHSLKFVHFNISQRTTAKASQAAFPSSPKKTFIADHDHTGVGLPPPILKICPGSTYTFSPELYIPGLIPGHEVGDLFKVEYCVQAQVGRDSTIILGTCRLPLTIGTHYVEPIKEEVLVDLSTPPHTPCSTISSNPFDRYNPFNVPWTSQST
uniref:Arrestin_C domain-containing protein n=1 Tax=Panagrellus redivivus TaxID=6233 RepID=A0A7E5A0Q5_PANRE